MKVAHQKAPLFATVALTIMLLTGILPKLHALNTDLFRPQVDNLGTFRLYSTKTLEPYKFSAGIYTSYFENALVIKGFTTGKHTRDIIDYTTSMHAAFEIGLHDRISAGFDIPFAVVRHVDLATTSTYNNHWGMEDIDLHTKLRLIKLGDSPIGISVIPFAEIPTGKPRHFTGDRGINAGVRAAIDWQFSRFYITTNIGWRNRFKQDNITVTGTNTTLSVDDEFLYGIGAIISIIPNKLQIVADITGSTPFQDFAKHERSSPIEALGGIRMFFKNRLIGLHAAGGAGINDGYGSPKFRLLAGITIQYPGTKYIPPAPKVKIRTKTITIEKETRTITIKNIFFDTNSAKIKAESIPALDKNVEMLKKYPDIKVRIEGHCDSRGSYEHNQRLSERRAESVRQYFIEQGISPDRLTAVGMGEMKPLVPNTSPENMAKNRRIELHIIEKIQKIVEETEENNVLKEIKEER